jgi:hypothetical protein
MPQTVEWPETVIYVCSATQGAIVNTMPIIYAGIERIAKVYVIERHTEQKCKMAE